MSIQQCSQAKPPVRKNGQTLYEEEFRAEPSMKRRSEQRRFYEDSDERRIARVSSKEELARADHVERLIIVGSISPSTSFAEANLSKEQRRRRSTTSSSQSSHHIDQLLQDGNNDWFFEKLLSKFDSLRARPADRTHTSDDLVYGGIERIIERRYYVKKADAVPKSDRVTSTTGLNRHSRKHRELSGTSLVSEAITTCSQCSSSTPSYVEQLRDHSDALRHEIGELKIEIEQLQSSQQHFFQQLQEQLRSKMDFTTVSQMSTRPVISPRRTPSDRDNTTIKSVIPLRTPQSTSPTPSESTASVSSSSSSLTSRRTTRDSQSTGQPRASPSVNSTAPTASIAEFMAPRNPSVAQTPPTSIKPLTKTTSVSSTAPVTEFIAVRKAPVVTALSTRASQKSSTSSVSSTPPASEFHARQTSTLISTPSVANQAPVSTPRGSVVSKSSSVGPAPPVAPPFPTNPSFRAQAPMISSVGPAPPAAPPFPTNLSFRAQAPMVSSVGPAPPAAPPFPTNPSFRAQAPVIPSTVPAAPVQQENEFTHRRVLSPRSQIVASSSTVLDSSDQSSESATPTFDDSKEEDISEPPPTSLGDLDMKDLVLYSSQLEAFGFTPLTNPVITNPNTSSTFWESVDSYIDNNRPAYQVTGRPPVAPVTNGHRAQVYLNSRRQLDKYNLEIRPQEIIESSAPLLMPPYDFSP